MSTSPQKLLHRISVPFLPQELVQRINQFEKLIIYGIIGGVAVMIDVGAFWIITSVTEMNVVIANALSIFIAMIYSFVMNTFFNFRTHSNLAKRFASFALVTGFGFVVSSAMLWLLVEQLGVNSVISKNLTLPVVFLVQFFLNSKFTFKDSQQDDKVLESIR